MFFIFNPCNTERVPIRFTLWLIWISAPLQNIYCYFSIVIATMRFFKSYTVGPITDWLPIWFTVAQICYIGSVTLKVYKRSHKMFTFNKQIWHQLDKIDQSDFLEEQYFPKFCTTCACIFRFSQFLCPHFIKKSKLFPDNPTCLTVSIFSAFRLFAASCVPAPSKKKKKGHLKLAQNVISVPENPSHGKVLTHVVKIWAIPQSHRISLVSN